MILDVLLREDGTARGHAADQRQAHLLAVGILQLDAARGTGQQRDDVLARQRAQVFFGGIGRLEAQLVGDFLAGGRHARFLYRTLDEPQDFALAWREIGIRHGELPGC